LLVQYRGRAVPMGGAKFLGALNLFFAGGGRWGGLGIHCFDT
jgi:hypothetical protein